MAKAAGTASVIGKVRDVNFRCMQVVHRVQKRTLDDLVAALKDLLNYIPQVIGTDAERRAFVEEHIGELYSLSVLLQELIDDPPSLRDGTSPESVKSIVRSYLDKIFKNSLKMRGISSNFAITHTFMEFIKGITYFDNQANAFPQRHPIYHRIYSCGDGTDAFRAQQLRCRQYGMPSEERDEVKARIFRCYVERLIYDNMYRSMHGAVFAMTSGPGNVPFTQDDGHMNFLAETRADFQSCYPCLEILVDIEYDPETLYGHAKPVELRITRISKCLSAPDERKATSTELYQRRLVLNDQTARKEYDPGVFCTRLTEGGNEYRKVQTFQSGEKSWSFFEKTNKPLDFTTDLGRQSVVDRGPRSALSSVHAAASREATIATHLNTTTRATSTRWVPNVDGIDTRSTR